jgi:hypothetical protein
VDDLQKLLTNVRAHYVDMFEAALQELREKRPYDSSSSRPWWTRRATWRARARSISASRYDLAHRGERRQRHAQHVLSPASMLKFEPESFHGGGSQHRGVAIPVG